MVLTRRPILARQDSGDTSQGQPCMGTRKRCVVEKNQPPLFWGMADFHPSSLDHWHSTYRLCVLAIMAASSLFEEILMMQKAT